MRQQVRVQYKYTEKMVARPGFDDHSARREPDYDEFGLLEATAQELGVPGHGRLKVGRTSVDVSAELTLSAIIWGSSSPEIVFLHGGAQNAHPWDSWALMLGRPALALDLPSHGQSGGGLRTTPTAGPSAYWQAVRADTEPVARAIRNLAPVASVVVGMSRGGLDAITIAGSYPQLVSYLVLV